MGARRIVVTDVDGTLVGDPRALDRFVDWHAKRPDGWRLVYATGRTRESLEGLIADTGMPVADAAIVSVGSEVYDRDGRPWPGWRERFAGWDADRARRALAQIDWLRPQPGAAQTRLKASYFGLDVQPDGLATVRTVLDEAGIPATVVYSSSLNLDVLPAGSGKGEAASVVACAFGSGAKDVLAFGDSGNDLQLFRRGFLGTIVANAEPDLMAAVGSDVYRSPYSYADGVLDGIRHWSLRRDPSSARGPAHPPLEPAPAG